MKELANNALITVIAISPMYILSKHVDNDEFMKTAMAILGVSTAAGIKALVERSNIKGKNKPNS